MKNLQTLAGKPLIEYTIKSAKNSKLVNKILVSTDNQKIANVSVKIGAEVPFLRPKKISQDKSTLTEVLRHILDLLSRQQSYIPDIITILQPTQPFRTPKMIDDSIKLLKKTNATCVLSVFTRRNHPYRSFWLPKKYLKPFNPNFEYYYQRQRLPTIYYPTGTVYTFWNKTFQKYNSIYGPKIYPLIADEKEIHLDIDSLNDLFVSEMTVLYWKKWLKKRQNPSKN